MPCSGLGFTVSSGYAATPHICGFTSLFTTSRLVGRLGLLISSRSSLQNREKTVCHVSGFRSIMSVTYAILEPPTEPLAVPIAIPWFLHQVISSLIDSMTNILNNSASVLIPVSSYIISLCFCISPSTVCWLIITIHINPVDCAFVELSLFVISVG